MNQYCFFLFSNIQKNYPQYTPIHFVFLCNLMKHLNSYIIHQVTTKMRGLQRNQKQIYYHQQVRIYICKIFVIIVL